MLEFSFAFWPLQEPRDSRQAETIYSVALCLKKMEKKAGDGKTVVVIILVYSTVESDTGRLFRKKIPLFCPTCKKFEKAWCSVLKELLSPNQVFF